MRRGIKFRGKRIDNGEWVVGFLVKMWGEFHIIDYNDENIAYPINCETIGQFTGVKDKNGREIYEGDIVRFLDADGIVKIYEVSFGEGGFSPVVEICWMADVEGVLMEVIGNIHDNSELLKTE